jgi:hypothetical protein
LNNHRKVWFATILYIAAMSFTTLRNSHISHHLRWLGTRQVSAGGERAISDPACDPTGDG